MICMWMRALRDFLCSGLTLSPKRDTVIMRSMPCTLVKLDLPPRWSPAHAQIRSIRNNRLTPLIPTFLIPPPLLLMPHLFFHVENLLLNLTHPISIVSNPQVLHLHTLNLAVHTSLTLQLEVYPAHPINMSPRKGRCALRPQEKRPPLLLPV